MASLLKELPSMTTILSVYASLSGLSMLIRTILNEMIPRGMRDFIATKFSDFFATYFSSDFTFFIEDRWQAVENETFRAVEVYLPTKVGPSTKSLLLGTSDTNNITAPPKPGIPIDAKVIDFFQGMRFEWTLCEKEAKKYSFRQKRYFQLKCKKNCREHVMQSYLPHISKIAGSILDRRETLNIYTYDNEDSMWESTVFKHPATFDTIAMDPEQKKLITEDLDLFVQRKEYFRSVGRAWKRGYLFYGPPGTGKSTLVAAIANYLRFNIYDLQLQVQNIHAPAIEKEDGKDDSDNDDDDQLDKKISFDPGVTLSGLLNFIDGLWSSCGDERIIIFTTNYKEKLDPALLRPGRMDVHVYMGHCTPAAFKKLASTYLGIKEHALFKCIEDLIQSTAITPAEVAQQLMKYDKPQDALQSLVEFINTKETAEMVDHGAKKEDEEEVIKEEVVKCRTENMKQDLKQSKILTTSVYLT
ncbi:hypothetical protein OIU76_024382 [Salix suchowensis]|nr:hypothetical protein OIU76_024382 [Salix suchowensis]